MSQEANAPAAELAAIPKFCPICGAIMAQQLFEGVLCWVCPDPDCGYVEPV
jgi:hypothetical protein